MMPIALDVLLLDATASCTTCLATTSSMILGFSTNPSATIRIARFAPSASHSAAVPTTTMLSWWGV